ncbi:MAG: 2Fe-2S iron-sulfur cluster binding domain-containing protein [Gammaproteobacteria bacterium]|nr:2Fe-2S iron-sulfur cluster binding domain-containing protein [Gammaproteobacteria bacterium]
MPDLLTVSRAARLIGVTRGALQKKIKAGELATFEGMVKISDLHRAFPKADIENDTVLERVTRIKDGAYAKRVNSRILPDAEVLTVRLQKLGKELAESRGQVNLYKNLVCGLDKKLAELGQGGGEFRAAATELKAWLGIQVELGLHQADLPSSLLAHDSFLRLMSAHVQLQPSGHDYFVEGNDSLLDAALRAGLSPAYGCSDGSCGQCKAILISGRTKGIEDRPQKYFNISDNEILLCCNVAVTDLVLDLSEARDTRDISEQKVVARVKQHRKLNDDILFLHLRTIDPQRLRFKSGQSVLLKNSRGISAEYPVASCPCDGQNLQFHIRRRSNEAFSKDLFNGLDEGTEFLVQGPSGDFVLSADSSRDIVFVAIETGFAPIKSLIEHAMALGVAESMRLYWVASSEGGHYMDNLCRSWADALDGFQYIPLSSGNESPVDCVVADVDEYRGSKIYIAGPDKLVSHLIDGLREAGISREHLVSCHVRC